MRIGWLLCRMAEEKQVGHENYIKAKMGMDISFLFLTFVMAVSSCGEEGLIRQWLEGFDAG